MSFEAVGEDVVAMEPIASEGTSLFYMRHADRISMFLEEWDAALDTEDGRQRFLTQGNLPAELMSGFGWGFWYGDFCIVDARGNGGCLIAWRR